MEDSTVQLVWRHCPGGLLAVTIGERVVKVDTEPGPGGAVVDQLAADTDHVAQLQWGEGAPVRVRFRTLAPPPGRLLSKVATIGDLHIGLRSFGMRDRIHDPSPGAETAGLRCAREAVAAAIEWGADLLLVKGDVTNAGRRIEWQRAASVLADQPIPVVVLPGNHEGGHWRSIEPWQAGAELGLHVVRSVEAIDLPGIRLVTGSTSTPGRSRGKLSHRTEDLVELAAGAPAALVALHHHLDHGFEMPIWPPGIPRAEADAFLDALAEAQPDALVTSGHTHRHRRRAHGPLTITTVGSTKDYPGGWAGYAVHEGGIRQVVRRTTDPTCLAWTDRTRRALGGLWEHLSPGTLDARCFSIAWGR